MEVLEKGITRLTLVPVRKSEAESSEMVTQLLFGDHYTVLDKSRDKKWLKIRVHYDSYEGWISANQHYLISQAYFDQINQSDYKITTDICASILFNKHFTRVLMGSIIPISTNELFKVEEQLAFDGEAKSLNQRREFEFLKDIALKYLDTPYLWGGKTPFGIDCSGLVQQVFKICGYKLYRDTSQQVSQGTPVENFDEAEPGDLLFFEGDEKRLSHVGIMLDKEKVIHASGKVRIDAVDENGIFNSENDRYSHKLLTVRRLIKN